MDQTSPLPMQSLALDDQPRYKLTHKGISSLSNAELLSLLINTGTRDNSALSLSYALLRRCSHNLHEFGKLTLADLKKIKGIGEAKATMLIAAIELGRRRHTSLPIQRLSVTSSQEIGNYLQSQLRDFAHEVFGVVFLNRAGKVLHFEIVSTGGLTGTVADPRIILKKAVEQNATSIILTHNHPSGNLNPSKADEELTRKIKYAASFLDITVLDHLIVSEEGYYSFADEGML